MADFCTIMTVVPTGGIDRSSAGPLGCGPTDLWGVAFAFAVALLPWLDVDAADTEDAEEVAGADDPLLDEGRLEAPPAAVVGLDDPPHAASSSTSDPSPVAAAHPLLRITSPIHAGWPAIPRASCSWPRASRYQAFPGRQPARPGNARAVSGLS
ncbi:MAG: hypothetical protein ABSB59_03835 [Streptosporangiaceae bacterium]|jgi:hypothetical protein